jgi:predicted metalloprotease
MSSDRKNTYGAVLIGRSSHGTREQRVQNFRDGLEGGGAACLDELR